MKNKMDKKLKEKEVNDQQLFDKIASEYSRKDLVPSSMIARRYQLLAAFKPILKTQKKIGLVVDVGCGVGTAAKYLKGKYSSYIGIDQSKKEIDLAKSLYKNNKNVKFIALNIKEVNLSQKADVVLCLGALHHMTDLRQVFQALRNIAKPEAILLIVEPQKSNLFINLLRNFRKMLDHSYSKDQVYFEEKELTGIFKRAGLTQIKVDFQGFFTPYFAQVIIPPQVITQYLSTLATFFDSFLNHLPRALKKFFSFNIIISARFPKDENFHAKKIKLVK